MSYRQLFYHIVIRPKNSEPVIVQDYEEALYRYIWGFIKDKGAVLYRIGGSPIISTCLFHCQQHCLLPTL